MVQMNSKLWFTAAETGDIATIRAMIVEGIDIHQRDDQERTAFHIASQNAHTDIMNTILAAKQMEFLRQIGIDPFMAALEMPNRSANENRRSA